MKKKRGKREVRLGGGAESRGWETYRCLSRGVILHGCAEDPEDETFDLVFRGRGGEEGVEGFPHFEFLEVCVGRIVIVIVGVRWSVKIMSVCAAGYEPLALSILSIS